MNINSNSDSVLDNDVELTPIQSVNKWGFVNSKMEIVIPCLYDFVDHFKEGLALVNFQRKWGYLNKEGDNVVQCKYDIAYQFENGIANVKSNGKWGVVDIRGKELINCKYDNLLTFKDDYAITHLNGKYGFVNRTGKELSNCRFEEVHDFCDGFARVKKRAGKNLGYGYIDKGGLNITPFVFEDALDFGSGFAVTKYKGKWGVINKIGQKIISFKYERIIHFSNDVFSVKLNGLWGFINKEEILLADCKYEFESHVRHIEQNSQDYIEQKSLYNFSFGAKEGYFTPNTFDDNLSIVRYTCYNEDYDYKIDEIINLYKHEGIYRRNNDDLTLVKSNGYYGFVNIKGDEIIPCIYDYAESFNDDLAPVNKENKYGYINKVGKVVIPFIYDQARPFHEGIAAVSRNDLWGYVDKTGEKILPCKYDFADHFSEGLGLIIIHHKCKFIDSSGKIKLDTDYDNADKFKNGLAPVHKNNKWGFINKCGEEIVPCLYDDIRPFNNGFAEVKKNGLCGFIDAVGREIIECIYLNVNPMNNGMAFVETCQGCGYIDLKGQVLLPFIYSYDQGKDGINIITCENGNVIKHGVFDTKNRYLFSCKSKGNAFYNESIVKAQHYRRIGFIDKYSEGAFYMQDFFDINTKVNESRKLTEYHNIEYFNDIDFITAAELKPEIEWVNIPSGTFIMGSQYYEVDRRDDELAHEVSLSSFKMSKCAITVEQFNAYLTFIDAHNRIRVGSTTLRRPMTNITWFEARDFAEWMGCRLPTEAEWEYACRAGTNSPFNTGKKLTVIQANYKCKKWEKPMPVGSYPCNEWGLFDMHGNVWEWCNDIFGEYILVTQFNPKGPLFGKRRVCRGGSYCDSVLHCRSAYRNSIDPKYSADNIGFRLVSIN